MRYLFLALVACVAAAPSRPQLVLDETDGHVDQVAFPRPGPPPVVDLSKYTIAQILNWTLNHPETKAVEQGSALIGREHHRTLPLHKLAFVVDKLEGVKAILADEKANLTLFAPDDYGLPSRPHHGHEHEGEAEQDDDGSQSAAVFADLVDGLADMTTRDEGDEDKERKRRFLRLAEIILKYHVAPDGAYTGRQLADVSTLVTALPYARTEGADHFRLRLRPTLFPRPSLVVNFYARARLEVKAKNGRIHLLSAPLLPPLSHLSEAFLFPQVFSTLTSAIQKVELDSTLAPWLHHHRDDDQVNDVVHEVLAELLAERDAAKEGKAIFTVIAPTNFAFKRLGVKLNLFLFSPFGRSILKDVLSYHVVPDVAFFSDYVDGLPPAYEDDAIVDLPALDADLDELSVFEPQHPPRGPLPPHLPLPGKRRPKDPDHDHPPPHHGPHAPHHGGAKVYHWDLPTLLGNQTVGADVYVYRLGFGKGPIARRIVFRPAVGEPVYSLIPDVPVWGGAIHAVPRLLHPELKHHEHGHRFANEL